MQTLVACLYFPYFYITSLNFPFIAKCPPGTFAKKKTMRYSKHQPNRTIETTTLMPYCRSCGVGSYQAKYGETSCLPCPAGYTTNTVRARSIDECIPTAEEICKKTNICLNGACVASSNYHYTCNCFKNYIGKFYSLLNEEV